MAIQSISSVKATARSSRPVGLLAIAALVVVLSACAPVQQGNDQSKDVNVNLVELKDAKYKTLPVAEGGLSPEMREDIDAKVLEFMASQAVPIAGCAIAITRNNQIAYLQGYGLADQATAREFTIATPSPVGSISKTLTALGIMTLVGDQEGDLNLDAPLLDQMMLQPGVDVGWSGNATLRDVLAHKGGFIEGIETLWDAAAFNDGASMAADFPMIPYPSLQPLFVFQGYKFEAGNYKQSWLGDVHYSNVGYSLAGTLLDYRSKKADIPVHMQGYERYIWHRVGRGSSATEPTMITAVLATDFRTTDIKNLARGYAENGSDLNFGDEASHGWGWEGPSGGWAMTIGDLARLMLIMQSDAVIDKATIDAQMRQDHGQLFDNGTRVGLGLELDANGTWFGKGGDILGYTADFRVWPSNLGTDWGVAFICNQKYAGKALTGQLREILGSTPGQSAGGGHQQHQEVRDPLVELSRQYEPFVRQYAEKYLKEGETPEQAWQQARKELSAYPNGPQLVDLVERGDVAGALRLLPAVIPAKGVPVRR